MNRETSELCTDAQRPVASLLEISRIAEEVARLIRQHIPAEIAQPPRTSPRPELITVPLVRAIIAVRRI